MAMGNIPVLRAAQEQMNWLEQRQTVISQNMANVNTPDYKPRDLVPLSFDKVLGNMTVNVPAVDTSRTRVGPGSGQDFPSRQDPNIYDTTLDGNSVVIEDEMMKASETSLTYQQALATYRKYAGTMRSILTS